MTFLFWTNILVVIFWERQGKKWKNLKLDFLFFYAKKSWKNMNNANKNGEQLQKPWKTVEIIWKIHGKPLNTYYFTFKGGVAGLPPDSYPH